MFEQCLTCGKPLKSWKSKLQGHCGMCWREMKDKPKLTEPPREQNDMKRYQKYCRRCSTKFTALRKGNVYCPECSGPLADRFMYEKRKELGVCYRCGIPVDNYVCCEDCREYIKYYTKKWQEENYDYMLAQRRERKERWGPDPEKILKETLEIFG